MLRLLRKQGATLPIPFWRMECAAGHESQIDFGTGAAVVGPDGKRRRTHVLRVVLSHSRKGYSEVIFNESERQALLPLPAVIAMADVPLREVFRAAYLTAFFSRHSQGGTGCASTQSPRRLVRASSSSVPNSFCWSCSSYRHARPAFTISAFTERPTAWRFEISRPSSPRSINSIGNPRRGDRQAV